MKILVTGGAGFIGSHVADKFLIMGHHVSIFDNMITGQVHNIPAKATFIEGDITDKEFVDKVFDEGDFDVVNHHAAQMDVRKSVADPVFDANVNILGMLHLLNASIKSGVKKFMFASTGGAIYGEQKLFPATEDHPTQPLSPYGIAKLTGEKYLYFYEQEYGLKYGITRYANVYGPRQNPHGEARVVAIFSNKLINNEHVTINGDGLQTRDYVYVDDVVDANAKVLVHPHSIMINVGTGIETNVVELYDHLKAVAGSTLVATHGPATSGEQRRSVISSKYAKYALGWSPNTLIETGLVQTYKTFLDNQKYQI